MDTVSTICVNLLSELYAHAGECGVVLPTNSFVGHAPPAVDCELLTVYPVSLPTVPTQFGTRNNSCTLVQDVQIGCQIWFCWPQPDIKAVGTQLATPTNLAEMEATAIAQMNANEYVLKQGVHTLGNGSETWEREAVIATSRSLRPRGALAGWEILWTIQGLML